MSKRLLSALLVVVAPAVLLGLGACDGTQPKTTCVLQTTARGGPPFTAKYTVVSAEGAGCAFLGTHKDAQGKVVTGETLGLSIYGTIGNVTVGVRPVTASVTTTEGVAVMPFTNDGIACTATASGTAVATVDDPNFDPTSFPTVLEAADGGGCTITDDGGFTPCTALADGGFEATSGSSSSGSSASSSASSSGASSSGSSSAGSSSGSTAASSSGSSASSASASASSSGSSSGSTSAASSSGSTAASSSGSSSASSSTASSSSGSTSSGSTAASSSGSSTGGSGSTGSDGSSSGSGSGSTGGTTGGEETPPLVKVEYVFSNFKVLQADDIPGTQLSADVKLTMTPVDPGGSSCTATLQMDAVWEPSAGACEKDSDCQNPDWELPGGGKGFFCGELLGANGYPDEETGTFVKAKACLPIGHVPVR